MGITIMKRIISLNGPINGGKTTFAEKLKNTAESSSYGLKTEVFHYITPVVHLARRLCNDDFMNYELFKDREYYGATGRQWIIHITQRLKASNPSFLIDALDNAIRKSDCDLAIVDGTGSLTELIALDEIIATSHVPIFVNFTYQSTPNADEPFYGDSRTNLIDECQLVNPSIESALND